MKPPQCTPKPTAVMRVPQLGPATTAEKMVRFLSVLRPGSTFRVTFKREHPADCQYLVMLVTKGALSLPPAEFSILMAAASNRRWDGATAQRHFDVTVTSEFSAQAFLQNLNYTCLEHLSYA